MLRTVFLCFAFPVCIFLGIWIWICSLFSPLHTGLVLSPGRTLTPGSHFHGTPRLLNVQRPTHMAMTWASTQEIYTQMNLNSFQFLYYSKCPGWWREKMSFVF